MSYEVKAIIEKLEVYYEKTYVELCKALNGDTIEEIKDLTLGLYETSLLLSYIKNLEYQLEEKDKAFDEAIKFINSKHYEYGDIESQDCEDYDIGVDEIEKILKILERGKNEE